MYLILDGLDPLSKLYNRQGVTQFANDSAMAGRSYILLSATGIPNAGKASVSVKIFRPNPINSSANITFSPIVAYNGMP